MHPVWQSGTAAGSWPDIPARALRVAGLHEDPDKAAEVRAAALTRIASERSLMNRIGAGGGGRPPGVGGPRGRDG
jgi:hypothetical protein